MQGYGGLVPIEEAAARPVGMIESGPAAGVVGAQFLAGILGDTNVIAADMGGTTFKVGVVQDGRFEYAREPMVDRYRYIASKIDLQSIGAGGGSIVDVDHRTMRPTVGGSASTDPARSAMGSAATSRRLRTSPPSWASWTRTRSWAVQSGWTSGGRVKFSPSGSRAHWVWALMRRR